MRTRCDECGGPLLTATMTEAEEARFAAAFVCRRCGRRTLETWEEAHASQTRRKPIEER